MNEVELSRALGWFSIGLGLTELVAARRLAEGLGDRTPSRPSAASARASWRTGCSSSRTRWSRAALTGSRATRSTSPGLGVIAADPDNPKRSNALLAFAAVAGAPSSTWSLPGAASPRRPLAPRIRAAHAHSRRRPRANPATRARRAWPGPTGGPRPARARRRIAPLILYTDGIEQIEPDEHETFEGIVRVMAGGGRPRASATAARCEPRTPRRTAF